MTDVTNLQSRDEVLNLLIRYHQARWNSRGLPGAFVSELFTGFIRRLLKCDGSVRLLQVSTKDEVLGVLLNLRTPRCDHSYVSGINYRQARHHPGLVVHAAVIEYLANLNLSVYDFMAGVSQYKQTLSSRETPVYWLRVERKNLRTSLAVGIRYMKDRVRPLIRRK